MHFSFYTTAKTKTYSQRLPPGVLSPSLTTPLSTSLNSFYLYHPTHHDACVCLALQQCGGRDEQLPSCLREPAGGEGRRPAPSRDISSLMAICAAYCTVLHCPILSLPPHACLSPPPAFSQAYSALHFGFVLHFVSFLHVWAGQWAGAWWRVLLLSGLPVKTPCSLLLTLLGPAPHNRPTTTKCLIWSSLPMLLLAV